MSSEVQEAYIKELQAEITRLEDIILDEEFDSREASTEGALTMLHIVKEAEAIRARRKAHKAWIKVGS